MADLELPILRALAFVLPFVLFLWARDRSGSDRELRRCDRRERDLADRILRMTEVNNAMAAHSFEYRAQLEALEKEMVKLRKALGR